MAFCLIPKLANEFLAKIKSGEIDVTKLVDMESSKARREFLAKHLGMDNAKEVNALFEKKLLLKNQEQAMISFIKEASGMKVSAKRDLLTRVSKMQELLTPETLKEFKQDLVNKRLGIDVTIEEVKAIAEQSKVVETSKTQAMDVLKTKGSDIKNWSKEDKAIGTEYGVKLAIFKDYIASLKPGMEKTSITRDFINAVKDPVHYPRMVGNLVKSLVASWDNSFFLNQGVFALFDPRTTTKWMKAFGNSFKDIKSALLGGDPVTAVKGEIYGRPNALNGNYEKMKLDIGLLTEEAIPTTVLEKVPVLGRFFKASNSAYTGAALRLRADIADMKIRQFENRGIDLTNKFEAESLGKAVNAFTGRGDVGRMSGENVNALVFSVRFAKSKFDVMTAHIFSSKVSNAVKYDAAKTLVRMIATSGAIMAISEAINPGSTDPDPRGTNFGKIRIGKTWYPTAISFGGLPNLIARTLVPTKHNGQWGLWMKNGNGKFTSLIEFNNFTPTIPKYGATKPDDLIQGYMEGKAAPIIKTLLDVWHGQDFNGNPSTPKNLLKNATTPISIGNLTKMSPEEEYKVFNAFMQILGSNTSIPKPPKEEKPKKPKKRKF